MWISNCFSTISGKAIFFYYWIACSHNSVINLLILFLWAYLESLFCSTGLYVYGFVVSPLTLTFYTKIALVIQNYLPIPVFRLFCINFWIKFVDKKLIENLWDSLGEFNECIDQTKENWHLKNVEFSNTSMWYIFLINYIFIILLTSVFLVFHM